MSAWLVSKHHIDILVASAYTEAEAAAAAGEPHPLGTWTPNLLGSLLWLENQRALAYRYRDERDTAAPAYGRLSDDALDGPPMYGLPVTKVHQQVLWHCWEYQCSEHPEFIAGTSDAARIFRWVTGRIAADIGEGAWNDLPQSEQSKWWGVGGAASTTAPTKAGSCSPAIDDVIRWLTDIKAAMHPSEHDCPITDDEGRELLAVELDNDSHGATVVFEFSRQP